MVQIENPKPKPIRPASSRLDKPEIPPILKQWLDFKPNIDPNNPNKREPSEHEKSWTYLVGPSSLI